MNSLAPLTSSVVVEAGDSRLVSAWRHKRFFNCEDCENPDHFERWIVLEIISNYDALGVPNWVPANNQSGEDINLRLTRLLGTARIEL